MTQEISALMDGELDPQESGRAIGVCCKDADAARLWEEYHLIGDALRGEAGSNSTVAARVAKALAAEPTVLSPGRLRPASLTRVALALARSEERRVGKECRL